MSARVALQTLTQTELPIWLDSQPEPVNRWVTGCGFTAKAGQHCLLASADGPPRRVLCGVGERRSLWSIGQMPAALAAGDYELDDDWSQPVTAQMALGFRLGQYRFERYTSSKKPSPTLHLPEDHKVEIERLCEAVG